MTDDSEKESAMSRKQFLKYLGLTFIGGYAIFQEYFKEKPEQFNEKEQKLLELYSQAKNQYLHPIENIYYSVLTENTTLDEVKKFLVTNNTRKQQDLTYLLATALSNNTEDELLERLSWSKKFLQQITAETRRTTTLHSVNAYGINKGIKVIPALLTRTGSLEAIAYFSDPETFDDRIKEARDHRKYNFSLDHALLVLNYDSL